MRPSRIAFTLVVPEYSSVETTVQIDIVPSGEGCDLMLTHTDVLQEYAEQTRARWEEILRRAAKVLTQ